VDIIDGLLRNSAWRESHRENVLPNANAPETKHPARAALFVAALGLVAFLLYSASIPCGFASLFHTPCPGCGSTRAMLALLHGDLHGFLHMNPLAPLMTGLVVALALQAFSSVLDTGTFRRVGDGKVGLLVSRGVLVVGVLEVLLWIARFGGFLGGPVPV
jgi:hypothetical protein